MEGNKIPSSDLTRNYARVKEEVKAALDRVLDSQCFILGSEVAGFEREMEAYLETPGAIGCASGTDALMLAMMSLDLRPGDEVITTPFSFFATASCIARAGGTPVFADVEPDSYNLSMEAVLEKITPRTRAVLPVHIFGQSCKLELIKDELARRGIVLIEDCAQAIGAHRLLDGKMWRVGAVGEIGALSFFPTKNLGCYGDGGMVTVNVKDGTAERIKRLRVHGAGSDYFHDEIGINSRLDAMQAAILRVRLRHLEEWTEERRAVAERYMLLFGELGLLDVITPPVEQPGNRHVYHQYVVRVRERRDELSSYLAERGIATRIYYPLSLHEQKCFSGLGYRHGDLPVSESLTGQVLALPIFPELLPEEQVKVAEGIAGFYGRH